METLEEILQNEAFYRLSDDEKGEYTDHHDPFYSDWHFMKSWQLTGRPQHEDDLC